MPQYLLRDRSLQLKRKRSDTSSLFVLDPGCAFMRSLQRHKCPHLSLSILLTGQVLCHDQPSKHHDNLHEARWQCSNSRPDFCGGVIRDGLLDQKIRDRQNYNKLKSQVLETWTRLLNAMLRPPQQLLAPVSSCRL